MTLFELFQVEAGDEKRRIYVAAIASGVVNALIIATINHAAASPATGDVHPFVSFVLLVGVYLVSMRYVSQRMIEIVEAIIHRIKIRIADKVTRIDFDTLEQIESAEICDRVTENCAYISDKAEIVISMMQSSFILVSAAIYLAWISMPAFVLLVFLCLIFGLIFLDIRQQVGAELRQTAKGRLTFLERMQDLLYGFKEIKLSRLRRRDLLEHIDQTSKKLRDLAINSANFMSRSTIYGDVLLVVMLAALTFHGRSFASIDAKSLAAIAITVNFLFGHYHQCLRGYLQYSRANMALAEIDTLERKLDASSRPDGRLEDAVDPWKNRASKIEVRHLEYAYKAKEGHGVFRIGPIDLEFRAGEVVFIVGGNGSGKSTLLRVLTGLSAPTRGSLYVDDIPVNGTNVASFRELVSAIYSDFHIFSKLHGLEDVDPTLVNRLIQRMGLESQTSYKKNAFTKISLSTGQRKRLAMIVALLDDRPVMVFDEWAAEQDPEFREYFYKELLAELRDEGKIVIVVSHDDRYFHYADRVVTMEYGKVRSIDTAGTAKREVGAA